MSKATEQYARAHASVLEAQEHYESARAEQSPIEDTWAAEPVDAPEVTEAAEALKTAHEALREAEEPVADLAAAAWETNRQAVADAKQALDEAITELGRIEVASGEAARRRDPVQPVLNADEKAACRAAFDQVEAVKETRRAAIARFKRGVTAEQIEAAT